MIQHDSMILTHHVSIQPDLFQHTRQQPRQSPPGNSLGHGWGLSGGTAHPANLVHQIPQKIKKPPLHSNSKKLTIAILELICYNKLKVDKEERYGKTNRL